MEFSKRIIAARKQKRLTQSEVANHLHVSRKTISHWENEQSYPDIDSLINISNFYGISIDSMLKEDQNMKKALDPNNLIFQIKSIISAINHINIIAFIVLVVGMIIRNQMWSGFIFASVIVLIVDYTIIDLLNDLKIRVSPTPYKDIRDKQIKDFKIFIPLAIGTFVLANILSFFNNFTNYIEILNLIFLASIIKLATTTFHYKYGYRGKPNEK
ncbi:hypothetical protein WR164_02840 [Philodulcilactobacillus myokoensis]|uniref:HTH cro/C1-type domain-containing protein n=1 Tax=Philodulcilactobacillus myokoensis TaxID=2929573 RepID=A0A9W6B0I2_9LACO|nr:helix-turn-helix transcriptional regulator [Philodulcilactobacillus myokoensis]GLB46305.1 hypothetical protein WR164_02840 [Philodulcilactobacillus myokoensis]